MKNQQVTEQKHKQIIQDNQKQKIVQKRTKKSKIDLPKVTRRRKPSDSQSQNLLPSIIPRSSDKQPVVSIGNQNQTVKFIISIPLTLLKQENKQCYVIIPIQKNQLAIKITKQGENLNIDALFKQKIESKYDKINQSSISEQQVTKAFNFSGKYVYLSGQQMHNKVIKSVRKLFSTTQFSQILKLRLKQSNSDFLFYINIRAESYLSDNYNGLINQGNTCYMNSYLQTLFHIPAFRNLVYEAQIQDQSRFPATLQDLFFNMSNTQKAVSPQFLVKSFGWGKKQASVQQDAQEFSCLFFEALQKKLNDSRPLKGYKSLNMHDLFKGQLNHYIQCTKVSTQNYEQFIDLQIPVLSTLEQSLDAYTSQVHLQGDNQYRTQQFGQQQAHKGVQISLFPPVLMLQLKRFQYDFAQQKNMKILNYMQYEQTFNFSKWSLNGQDQIYDLYAVLVHQGSKAQSGHYYCFIRTQKGWYKFNDQFVQQVPKQNVFQYNFGGFHQSLEFDAKQMKINKKFIQSKSTAYMLVYIKSQMKQSLMKQNLKYPEWLLKKDEYKIQLQQMKKNKKNYFYNVKLIDWERDLKNKKCSDVGFLTQQVLQQIQKLQTLQKIPKKSTIQDWLNQKDTQIDDNNKKSKKGSKIIQNSFQDNPIGVYTYLITSQKKEILTGFQNKSHHSMQDLFKDSLSPLIFKAPIQAKKHQFLVILKKYELRKDYGNQIQWSFNFYDYFIIQKETQIKFLFNLLKQKYVQSSKQQNKLSFKFNFFIENQKLGLINISQIQEGFLPIVLPNKNQLLICIIEKIQYSLTQQQINQNCYKAIYDSRKEQVCVQIIEQRTKYCWQAKQMNLSLTCIQLREYIFNDILKQRKQQYQSTQNIVIRAKQKKCAKNFTQIVNPNMKLKQLIKYQNKIQFCYSSLSIGLRLNQEQKIIYYRFKDYTFSQPIKIIVDKNETLPNLIALFKKNQKTLQYLNSQGVNQDQAQLFLFGKDKLIINDYVDKQGKIYSKGDMDAILKKQKNSIAVVQSVNKIYNPYKMHIQTNNDEQNQVIILLHHLSQASDRVGIPIHIKIDKKIKLIDLRNIIFDLLDTQTYQWQNKLYKFNPFKTRLLLYVTSGKRFIELHDQQTLQEIRKLKIQDKKQKQMTKKSKAIQSKRKASSQIQNIKQADNNNIQQNGNNQHQQNKNGNDQKENQQLGIKQPQTIFDAFPKAKILKIQIIHNDLIKPNIALRLNVDG